MSGRTKFEPKWPNPYSLAAMQSIVCRNCGDPSAFHHGPDLLCQPHPPLVDEGQERVARLRPTDIFALVSPEDHERLKSDPSFRSVRSFDTGATRNNDSSKLDYEGFLSPAVLERYAEYMHQHRKQKDGTVRDSDNWQKGIPKTVYLKSLIRHTMDFWRSTRGGVAVDPDAGKVATATDLACAIMFNIMGWLHEELKAPDRPDCLGKGDGRR